MGGVGGLGGSLPSPSVWSWFSFSALTRKTPPKANKSPKINRGTRTSMGSKSISKNKTIPGKKQEGGKGVRMNTRWGGKEGGTG